MALSNEFYEYMDELQKIKYWEKLPNTDPRIVKLHELANVSMTKRPEPKNGKRVVVFEEGKFVQAFNSASELAEFMGMRSDAITAMARGERRCPAGLQIEYIKSEVI